MEGFIEILIEIVIGNVFFVVLQLRTGRDLSLLLEYCVLFANVPAAALAGGAQEGVPSQALITLYS